MEIFHMWDIVSLLGLPMPTAGRSSYYIQCPCCDENPREKHLNINLKKEVFRCPRCGISRGIFDLFALYTRAPRDKVRRELVERIGLPELMARQKKNIVEKQKEECPLADIELRNSIYTALLDKLSLAADHKENLMNRGLTEQDVELLKYKTTPVVGMSAIAKQLQMTLEDLRNEGLLEIKTAFDMDFATNHHVQNGYNSLLQLLGNMGFPFGTYLWDPRYKGLDDYIWECCLQRQTQ